MENEKNPWARLTRKAVHGKVEEAKRARELDAVVRELHGKLTEAVEQRDAVEEQATEIVGQRDATIANVKSWFEGYVRGQFSAGETLGGIGVLVGGNALAVTSVLERRRVTEQMHVLTLMVEATTRLDEIEVLLQDNGVPGDGDHVQQVREIIAQRTAAETDKHRMWKMVQQVIGRLNADEELREIFAREDHAGLEDYLEAHDG